MSQLFCCPRRRRAACRCGGLNAVTEGLRTFACHHVRIQDHGIVTKKKKGEV
jgi:hypothetical protein